MAASQADVAAHLLERLLAEPDFRARFRRDPAAACREAGLDELAEEMSLGAGKAMMTLDVRESKSSLAGVLMAAAMEGVGLYELSEHVLPHLQDIPAEVGDVLSRVNLPSIQGALSGGPPAPPAAAPLDPADAADAATGGGGGGGAAAAAANAAPAPKASAAPPELAGERKPPAAVEPHDAPEKPKHEPRDAPPEPRDAAPKAAVSSAPVDPSQLGAEGSGGAPTPESRALLDNHNVVFDPDGVADLEAGRIDPRVVAVLTKLSHDHKITVSCMCSDHSKFTTGGSVSNHHFGRGVDIAAIDGVPVNASNFDAREIATQLQDLDPSIRPNEIGTPWAISGPGYFTDAGHQDHLHIGFKDELAPGFTPPPDLAAPQGVVKSGDTLAFATPKLAQAAEPKASDTLGFVAAVDQSKGGAIPDIGPTAYPGDNASKEQLAAWMAGEAKKRGLPPELPVMASLVESGLKNLNYGDADSVGFFQMRASVWDSGPYAGYQTDPEKQIDWFLDRAEAVKAKRIAAGQSIDDPNQYGNWVADVELPAEQYRGRYQLQLANAQELLKNAPQPLPGTPSVDAGAVVDVGAAGDGSSVGAAALRVAQTQLGVREIGSTNTGPQVDEYLAAAGVPPGNPWCASFVAWSLQKAGHKMPGGGWAGVATWVRNAEQAGNGLKLVSAADARPGDIVAYDWGGQSDFGADGHIGFLASDVRGGQFTALEGNNADAVSRVPRHMGGANIVFIRVEGNARAGAPVDLAPTPHAPSAPVDPGQFGAEGTGGTPSPETEALLKNGNVVFDSTGIADLKAGRVDPRVVAVLTRLSQDHKITVSSIESDHSKFTAGGSVSNHYAGRGVDIAAIDGVPVNPSNFDAREIAMKLQDFDTSIRPSEIGSPWAISGPGYFTDAAHQNHLHIGFDEPITPDWKPPADLAAPGQQVGQPPTAPKPTDTLTFQAPAEAKTAAAAADAKPDTLRMAAVEPQGGGVAPEIAARGYPGDDASKAELAAWMAGEAKKRGLPPELPVMASLVESGLKNLNYGDADSVGFFQMRASVWDSGPYAGYQTDPEKQIDWFLDRAEAVKAKRIAAGQSIDDPNQYGNWVADVELPAEQYRGRYQLQLAEAQDLLKQAPAAPPADALVDAVAPGGGGAAGARALAAVAEAKKYLGTPYQWGGSTPETNFDCSGLVQWSYAQAGIQIPRVTYDQIDAPNGTPVSRDELLPGDLVFFADGGDVHHVGMSLGGDKFIHAPHTGDVVKISSLNEPYYKEQFAGGRRFDPAGAAPPPDPTDVAKAQAHVAVDAAEVRRNDSLLFKAVRAQEAAKARATVQFLKAIDPAQAKAAANAGADTPVAPPELTADAPPAPPVDLAGVGGDYPGNDASQAQLAKWLAKQAEKAGLPPELPVMASLVESGVKNLNYGDADSVGFFQMRTSIWNSGPYAGYAERPELQAKWFIDNALAVKRKRIAAGDVNFGKDPSKWGEWIADIERPAEQYRGRYQLRLDEARSLLR